MLRNYKFKLTKPETGAGDKYRIRIDNYRTFELEEMNSQIECPLNIPKDKGACHSPNLFRTSSYSI